MVISIAYFTNTGQGVIRFDVEQMAKARYPISKWRKVVKMMRRESVNLHEVETTLRTFLNQPWMEIKVRKHVQRLLEIIQEEMKK